MKLICPACAQRKSDRLGELDGYDVFQCSDATCRTFWRTPMLGHVRMQGPNVPREGDKYTEDGFYHKGFCAKAGLATFAERYRHDYLVAEKRIEKIRAHADPRFPTTLLDVGCGNGAFVAAALDAGYDAAGIDPGASMVQAKEQDPRLTHRLHMTTDIPDRTGGWDVITCHDVLEHLADPYATLRRLARVLVRDGLLVVEEPDPGSTEAKLEGLRWRQIKPFEHTYLPSTATWRSMMEAVGLSVVDTLTPVPSKVAMYARRVA